MRRPVGIPPSSCLVVPNSRFNIFSYAASFVRRSSLHGRMRDDANAHGPPTAPSDGSTYTRSPTEEPRIRKRFIDQSHRNPAANTRLSRLGRIPLRRAPATVLRMYKTSSAPWALGHAPRPASKPGLRYYVPDDPAAAARRPAGRALQERSEDGGELRCGQSPLLRHPNRHAYT